MMVLFLFISMLMPDFNGINELNTDTFQIETTLFKDDGNGQCQGGGGR